MRRELKKRGVRKLKVVYSEEIPTRPIEDMSISCRTHCICPPGAKHKCTERRDIPGSVAFVPSVAGLIIAGEVVKDLCKDPTKWGVQVIEDYALKRDDYADFSPRGNVVL